MNTPNNAMLRNAANDNSEVELYNMLDAWASANFADSINTRVHTYSDPLEMAKGCIDSVAFHNAMAYDALNEDDRLSTTVSEARIRRSSAAYRALHNSVTRVLEEHNALKLATITANAAQNQRNRVETFARHWITQLNRTNGPGHDSNNGYASYKTPSSAIVYDADRNCTLVMFMENPEKEIRTWLRDCGFNTCGTNNFWYRYETDDTDSATFRQYAENFAEVTANVYSSKIAHYQQKRREVRRMRVN